MFDRSKTGIDAHMSINVKSNVKNIIRVKSTGTSGLSGVSIKTPKTGVSKSFDDSYSHQVTAELDKSLTKRG